MGATFIFSFMVTLFDFGLFALMASHPAIGVPPVSWMAVLVMLAGMFAAIGVLLLLALIAGAG